VVVVISIAFFAKGFGNNGWCILSDTSPKEIPGVSGEVFNSSGNIACIVTPLCIGYIPAVNLAILDVSAMGILSGVSYLPVIVSLKRLQIDPPTAENGATVSGYKRSGAKRTIQNV
jgi:ACS family glucarate transporter-like MFS transporter